MRTEVQRAICRTRRSLNAIGALSGGLLWLAPAAVLAGLLLLLLMATGKMPAAASALAVWGVVSALAFCVGALVALRRRLDDRAAAAWLDERLGTRELLSAALGLSRPGHRVGRFDREVAERAEAVAAAPVVRHPGWPFGALLRRAIPAAAACLALPAILAWADPAALGKAFVGGGNEGGGSRLEIAGRRRPAARLEGSASLASGADAAAIARFLFAEDSSRAEAAERALREGRADEFRNLLERAVRDLDNRLARGVKDDEREGLLDEKRRLDEALAALDESTWSGDPSNGSSQGPSSRSSHAGAEGGSAGQVSGGGESAADSSSRSPPRRKSAGDDAARADGGAGRGGSEGASPGDGSGRKGDMPGSGPGAGPGPAPGQESPRGGEGSSGGNGPGSGGPEGSGEGSGAEGGGSGGNPSGGGGHPGDAGSSGGVGQASDRGRLSPQAKGGLLTVAPDRAASFFDYVLKGRDPGAALPGLFAQASRAAEAPIANEGLPLEYVDFLRSYFLALERQLQEGDATQGSSPSTKGAP